MSADRDIFASLHEAGTPLLLYNIWDAGSARAVAEAGAPALATGSLSLAGAQGYSDGELMPLHEVLAAVRRIVAAVDLPLSVDFEGGYAADTGRLADHARSLAETGAVGCNFEDRVVQGEGLYPVAQQAQRIAAVASSGLFVNARTDVFLDLLMRGENPDSADLLPEAIERAAAYAEAGAECFFVPGLADPELVARLCEAVALPVNIMLREGMADAATYAQAGVARISRGPQPWAEAMRQVTAAAALIYRRQ